MWTKYGLVSWRIYASLGLNEIITRLLPQSHPTTGPVRFLSPVRFLARKAEGSARRNFTSVLFPWSHQATGPVRLRHVCILMVWLNNSQDSTGTPCGRRADAVRAQHGNLQCFLYPTGPVRGPCATCKGAVRRPYGHVRELTQPKLAKIRHGRRIWPYGTRAGPVRAPLGCSRAVYNL